jgi:hypothetical protein
MIKEKDKLVDPQLKPTAIFLPLPVKINENSYTINLRTLGFLH